MFAQRWNCLTTHFSGRIPVVKRSTTVLISPHYDTRATQGGGVTFATSSASWATCLAEPVLSWQLWSECLAAGDLSTKCGDNLKVLTDRPESDGGRRTESVTNLLVNQKLANALLLGEWQTCYQLCFNSVITACGWGGGYYVLHLRRVFVVELWDDVVELCWVLCDVRQGKRTLDLLEPHGWLFGTERRGTTTDASDSESRIGRLHRPCW